MNTILLPTPTGQVPFTPIQLTTLRRLVQHHLGIHLSEEKDYLLRAKVGRLMDHEGITDVDDLIYRLVHPSEKLAHALARFLTTNHTFFFREREHFDLLGRLVREGGEPVPRIWCAASSTGEEIYSIMIYLLEAGVGNFLLLASDINLEVLKACRQGIYHPERLQELPRYLLVRYFDRVGPSDAPLWQVKAELRERVILKRINLVDPHRFEREFHFIFCRNVMIYFDSATQAAVVSNLLSNLAPEGVLFVGHTEPLLNCREKVATVAPSVYRKQG